MSEFEKPRPDLLTILAITIAAWLAWATVHEVFGHATACILAGGRPLAVSTSAVDCDTIGVTASGLRNVYAAGSAANLLVALFAGVMLRSSSGRSASAQYFLWLTFAFHLLHAGTLLLDGPFGKNDWAGFLIDIYPAPLWNIAIAVLGLLLVSVAMFVLRRTLSKQLNSLSAILSISVLPLAVILILNALGIWISRFDLGNELVFGAPRQVWWLLLFPVSYLSVNAKTRVSKTLPWLVLLLGSVLLMRVGVLGLEASSLAWILSIPAMSITPGPSRADVTGPLRRDDLWLIVGVFSLIVYLMLGRGLGSVGGIQLF